MNNPQNPHPYQHPPPVATEGSVPPAEKQSKRKGKIARLPKKLREVVNQMIDDGHTYAEIIAKLGAAGQGLSEPNLTSWRNGGFQEWVQKQERLDGMRVRQEFARDLVEENEGVSTHQAASQIAALNLCDIIDDFKASVLKKSLHEEPETYARLLNAYTRLLQVMPNLGGTEAQYEQARVEEKERQAKLQDQDADEKSRGLSDKARRQMEQKLNLM